MSAPAQRERPPGAGTGSGSGSGPGSAPSWRDTWFPRPERRRRADLVVVALILVAAVVGTVLVLRAGDESSTTLTQAPAPLAPVSEGAVPTALTEAWRAANPAGAPRGPGLLAGPATSGPAVATGRTDADGSVVSGLDAATGTVAWEYRRPAPLCALDAAFGEIVAMFSTSSPVGTFCSQVSTFDPSSGARGPTRSADVRPGTRLLADGSHVTATGRDYLEVWRDDLVATLEYGMLPTPVQGTPQARANCPHVSVAAGADSVAVLERCPAEPSDRISVVSATPAEYDKPEDRFSVLSGVTGGRLVATADDRTALQAPDGTLRVYDGAGTPVATVPLGAAAGRLPDDATTDPAGQSTGVRLAGPVLLFWTGTATLGLDPGTLLPRWTLPGTLGPGAAVPTGVLGAPTTVLVPVPAGLVPVDAATGAARPVLPVDRRADPAGPVGVAVVGSTVVEQRGDTVVGLRPPG